MNESESQLWVPPDLEELILWNLFCNMMEVVNMIKGYMSWYIHGKGLGGLARLLNFVQFKITSKVSKLPWLHCVIPTL